MIDRLRAFAQKVTTAVDAVDEQLSDATLKHLDEGDLQKLYDEIRGNAVVLLAVSQRIVDADWRLMNREAADA